MCYAARADQVTPGARRAGSQQPRRVDHRTEFGDFTEANYLRLLRLARRHYRFARFGAAAGDKHLLWRHDIDISPMRALRLARIEAEEGVVATYFLFPRSLFYNLLNEMVQRAVRQIVALGHDIGLHFDPLQYPPGLPADGLIGAIAAERDLITREFGAAPVAVSFHNYGVIERPVPEDDLVCGLANAYAKQLRDNYGYVSDSNGIWRYRRLHDVLDAAAEERLQVLTHPEWWTPEAMPPRQRVQRAIDGYSAAMGGGYDDVLARSDRPNLR
jgi:hypothetical protein